LTPMRANGLPSIFFTSDRSWGYMSRQGRHQFPRNRHIPGRRIAIRTRQDRVGEIGGGNQASGKAASRSRGGPGFSGC
jgi:hypothetical protein